MKKVFIVGFEATYPENAISFMSWFNTSTAQENHFERYKNDDSLNGILYHGEVLVPVENDSDSTTDYINNWLDENGWENAFPENQIKLEGKK